MVWKQYKKCKQCWEIKELTSEFWHRWEWVWGFHSKCKVCRNKNNREYNKQDEVKERYKKYREKNKEHLRGYLKEWKRKNKDKTHSYYIKAKDWSIKEYRRKNKEAIAKKQKTRYDKMDYDKLHKQTYAFIEEKGLRPDFCPICWRLTRVIAHHPDNNIWNKIVWCCYSCHQLIHLWEIKCPKPIDLLNNDNENENGKTN